MARILLTTTPWQPFHTLRELFPNVPPYGLQVVAGALKNDSHQVKVADFQHLPPVPNELHHIIKIFNPEVIGLANNCIANTPIIIKESQILKKAYPNIKFLIGGQIPSMNPEMFLLTPNSPFDAVALFETETTISEIIRSVLNPDTRPKAPGMAYRNNNDKLEISEPQRHSVNLDDTAFPFLEGSLKKASFGDGLASAMETSRGCKYGCSFCSIPSFYGPKCRYKSKERLFSELKDIHSKGVREIYFLDDCFGTNPLLVRALFEDMINNKFNFRFMIQIRADIIVQNPSLIDLGAKAGLFMAIVGFEGYSSKIHKNTNKGNSSEMNTKAAQILKDNNITVYGTHVFGSPDSSFKDNFLTFWKGRFNSDVFRMTIFTPLPGSCLFEKLEKKKKIRSHNPEDYYYGEYLIKDNHNPFGVKFSYFAFLLIHYIMPDTILKALFSPNIVTKVFNQRAYKGAFRFVFGKFIELFQKGNIN